MIAENNDILENIGVVENIEAMMENIDDVENNGEW